MSLADSVYLDGREDRGMEIAITMYNKGYPIKEIASIIDMPTEKLEEAVREKNNALI